MATLLVDHSDLQFPSLERLSLEEGFDSILSGLRVVAWPIVGSLQDAATLADGCPDNRPRCDSIDFSFWCRFISFIES